MNHDHIVTVATAAEEKFLRRKAIPFTLSPKGTFVHEGVTFTPAELRALLAHMKKMMHQANGIGLSANQIGYTYRLFVAEVPSAQGDHKFYAVFNPEIEKFGAEKEAAEEGCLSVPGIYGSVARAERLTLKGLDRNGKALKIKAWGLLARVFQHEVDHLNGILFIDKAKRLQRTPESERLRVKAE